jgi:hypothetical protein
MAGLDPAIQGQQTSLLPLPLAQARGARRSKWFTEPFRSPIGEPLLTPAYAGMTKTENAAISAK